MSSSVLNSPLKRAPGKPSSHIRVVVRVRPVNALEKEKGHAAIISSAEDGKGVGGSGKGLLVVVGEATAKVGRGGARGAEDLGVKRLGVGEAIARRGRRR